MAQKVTDLERYSAATRTAILREANFLIIMVTNTLGLITRSTSVRNAFELYVPFLDLCKTLVGDSARLLLSSEWQYVPFTYPQNLAVLPTFIIIGLPAPEFDNILIFPSAGHELGHSVWNKKSLAGDFSDPARQQVDRAFIEHKDKFYTVFPDLKDADLDQDLFVQYIKSSVLKSILAQLEELFSDFLGLLLFGESYLYAFEYLVSPQVAGVRSREYPDTVTRAKILEKLASEKLGLFIGSYSNVFTPETPYRSEADNFVVEIADLVVSGLIDALFCEIHQLVVSARIPTPTAAKTDLVLRSFEIGVPFDGEATIGDLINAAWRIYRSPPSATYARQGRETVDYLSDLVMKSIEIYEIRKHLS